MLKYSMDRQLVEHAEGTKSKVGDAFMLDYLDCSLDSGYPGRIYFVTNLLITAVILGLQHPMFF